jgi:hypothetical protein
MVVSVDGELECVIGKSLYSGSRLKLVEEGVCRDRGGCGEVLRVWVGES